MLIVVLGEENHLFHVESVDVTFNMLIISSSDRATYVMILGDGYLPPTNQPSCVACLAWRELCNDKISSWSTRTLSN